MAGHQSDGAVGCLKFRDKMGSLGFTCYSHLDNAFILVCAALSSKPSSLQRDTTNIVGVVK